MFQFPKNNFHTVTTAAPVLCPPINEVDVKQMKTRAQSTGIQYLYLRVLENLVGLESLVAGGEVRVAREEFKCMGKVDIID